MVVVQHGDFHPMGSFIRKKSPTKPTKVNFFSGFSFAVEEKFLWGTKFNSEFTPEIHDAWKRIGLLFGARSLSGHFQGAMLFNFRCVTYP